MILQVFHFSGGTGCFAISPPGQHIPFSEWITGPVRAFRVAPLRSHPAGKNTESYGPLSIFGRGRHLANEIHSGLGLERGDYVTVFNRLYPFNNRIIAIGGRNLSTGKGGF